MAKNNHFIGWVLNVLTIIGSFILGFFVIDRIGNIGKNKDTLFFRKVPGHKGKVQVFDPKGKNKIIKLPKDPKTKKQIKIEQIETIGISKKAYENKKETYNVEIKHNITNRRVVSNTNNSSG